MRVLVNSALIERLVNVPSDLSTWSYYIESYTVYAENPIHTSDEIEVREQITKETILVSDAIVDLRVSGIDEKLYVSITGIVI